MGKLSMLAGGAVGYVLGARAGRERYDQIKGQAQRVWTDPRVQRKAEAAKDKAASAVDSATGESSGAHGETIYAAKRVAGAEPSNNEGPENRQPAPPMGI